MIDVRIAQCSCGSVSAECRGEPVRVSVCHCLACQRRTGSAFAAQARFPQDHVSLRGNTSSYVRVADSGTRIEYSFCPRGGATVSYVSEDMPGLIAIPLGAFADPTFPAPTISVYEHRKHPWTAVLGDAVVHEFVPD